LDANVSLNLFDGGNRKASIQNAKRATRNFGMTEERFKPRRVSSLSFRDVYSQLLATSFRENSAIFNLILTKSSIDFLVGKYDWQKKVGTSFPMLPLQFSCS